MAKPNETGSSKFWSKLGSTLLIIMLSPTFLKTAGLVSLLIFFIVASGSMASSNSLYNCDCAKMVFTVNSSNSFILETSAKYRPPHIPADHFVSILASGRRVEGMKIWDDRLFSTLRTAFLDNPWVEKVLSIQRRFPNIVWVNLSLRRPFSAVAWKGKKYIIDRQGVLLPLKPDTDLGIHLITITGVQEPPPSRSGEIWKTKYVEDSLGLMKYITNNMLDKEGFINLLSTVERFECAPANQSITTGKPAITMRLLSGEAIIWDMYFEEESAFGRPGSAHKLQELKKALKRVEDIKDISYIDLSYEDAIIMPKGSKDAGKR